MVSIDAFTTSEATALYHCIFLYRTLLYQYHLFFVFLLASSLPKLLDLTCTYIASERTVHEGHAGTAHGTVCIAL